MTISTSAGQPVLATDKSSFGSEERDGMIIGWDVPIAMDDGVLLRCDVFRPTRPGRYPVILSSGPYAKGLSFQEGYPTAWQRMVDQFPEIERGSSGLYQNWEVVDPQRWVPHGYVCVRVDSRGAGRSPGFLEPWSPRETRDLHDCIEWAAAQPWSTGKVALNGISYYAMNQWQVAATKPPHLAAICVWEGAADFYRDVSHHGGIYCTFVENWYAKQVTSVQHGLGRRGPLSRVTEELVCGPQTHSDEELAARRCDLGADFFSQPLESDYFTARSARWSEIEVPILTAANWGGQGLHLRGNLEGFMRAASRHKWLEIHGREHWTEFYTDYGRNLQKRFLDHFLKGADNGWDTQPAVKLQVRGVDGFIERDAAAWPLPCTRWSRLYLDAAQMGLMWETPQSSSEARYEGLGKGITFIAPPAEHEVEITGPLSARLFVSSQTTDCDLFLIVRLFAPDLREVTFHGALDPHTPIAQGWLRGSHRKLDETLSTPWRPYHTHDCKQPLEPGVIYEMEVEIWPTSIVVPAGYRLGLTVRGRDYEYPGPAAHLSNIKNPMRGCGPFLHDDPRDRPPEIFGGKVTIHAGAAHPSSLLIPIIPAARQDET